MSARWCQNYTGKVRPREWVIDIPTKIMYPTRAEYLKFKPNTEGTKSQSQIVSIHADAADGEIKLRLCFVAKTDAFCLHKWRDNHYTRKRTWKNWPNFTSRWGNFHEFSFLRVIMDWITHWMRLWFKNHGGKKHVEFSKFTRGKVKIITKKRGESWPLQLTCKNSVLQFTCVFTSKITSCKNTEQ